MADQVSPNGWKTLISSSKHVACGPQLLHNMCFITDIKHAKLLGKNGKVMMMIIIMCTAIRLLGIKPLELPAMTVFMGKTKLNSSAPHFLLRINLSEFHENE